MKIPGTRLVGRLRDFIVKQYHALLQIRDKPHAIAGGVAIGIFFGFLFVPMKTALSLLTAWLLRCSKIAAVIAVTAHDVLIPFLPIYLRWEYIIGYWILHHQMPPKLRIDHRHFHPEQLLATETYRGWWRSIHERMNVNFFAHFIGPMLIGSAALGIPAAAILYFVILRIAKRAQAAKAAKAASQEKDPVDI